MKKGTISEREGYNRTPSTLLDIFNRYPIFIITCRRDGAMRCAMMVMMMMMIR